MTQAIHHNWYISPNKPPLALHFQLTTLKTQTTQNLKLTPTPHTPLSISCSTLSHLAAARETICRQPYCSSAVHLIAIVTAVR